MSTLPNPNDWDALSFDVKLYIALRLFLAVQLPRIQKAILKFLYFIDLWLFPPLAFVSAFITASRYIPIHPIKPLAILSIAFMSSTLTLFLIRPPKKIETHWIQKGDT